MSPLDVPSDSGGLPCCGSMVSARRTASKETKREIKGVREAPGVTGTGSQGGVGPLGGREQSFLAQSTRKQDKRGS